MHTRVYQLNDAGNVMVLSIARSEGARGYCSSCTNTTSGAIAQGFSATVLGRVTDSSTSPPTLEVTRVLPASSGCPDPGSSTVDATTPTTGNRSNSGSENVAPAVPAGASVPASSPTPTPASAAPLDGYAHTVALVPDEVWFSWTLVKEEPRAGAGAGAGAAAGSAGS